MGEERGMRKWNGNKNNSDAFANVPPEAALVHVRGLVTTYLLRS